MKMLHRKIEENIKIYNQRKEKLSKDGKPTKNPLEQSRRKIPQQINEKLPQKRTKRKDNQLQSNNIYKR